MTETEIPDPTRPQEKVRQVFVRNLVRDALIGIFGEERDNPQAIRVNVDLAVMDPGPEFSGSITEVVRYDEVVDKIDRIIAQGHIPLVESLAERIAQACLGDNRVISVRVSVEKLEAIANAESVGVAIFRTKASKA